MIARRKSKTGGRKPADSLASAAHPAPSDSRRRGAHHSQPAFTLVEVLMALALLTVLLLAMNQFIFSMGELWGKNRQQRLFEQHVRAVTRHVEDMLQRAAVAPAANRGLRVMTSPVAMVASGPLLTFDLRAGDRVLPWPESPLPDVQCSLDALADRGLVLHWQSRWELNFEKVAPRTVVLSPLVKRLDYDYYRPEMQDWQTQSSPPRDKDGNWTVPSRLRLRFEYGKLVADAVVRVPSNTGALPAF